MIDEASVVGIINDPRSKPSEDQYQALIDVADRHGLKVILVGRDCDMGGDLMKRIVESDRFEVIQQCFERPGPLRQSSHGSGPRDKWGRLK